MGKRLGLGLLKGLVIGAAIGSGITFGLHWPTPSGGLLAYLLALGVGGTTGIFAGRAPWKDGAWVEAAVKGLFGVLAGALLYWLSSSYAAFGVPWPGAEAATAWTALPPLYLAAISAVYGALVELDHDPAAEKKTSKAKPATPRARVADEHTIEDAVVETKAARKRI